MKEFPKAKGKGSRAINTDLNAGKQSRLMFAAKPATIKPLVSNENEDPSPPAPVEISKHSKLAATAYKPKNIPGKHIHSDVQTKVSKQTSLSSMSFKRSSAMLSNEDDVFESPLKKSKKVSKSTSVLVKSSQSIFPIKKTSDTSCNASSKVSSNASSKVPLAEQNPNTSHAAKPHDKKRYLLSKNSAFEQPLQKKSEISSGRKAKSSSTYIISASPRRKEYSKRDMKKFKCQHCDYSTDIKSNFTVHSRNHSGDKPYRCDECPFSTTTSSNLKQHLLIHTGEKPFSCDLCPYSTTTSSSLKIHCRTHTDEKPYTCTICVYSSISFTGLQRHMRSHTQDKPYKCQQCDFAGNNCSDLAKHVVLHTMETNYLCNECPATFNRRSSRNRHVKKHETSKNWEFECPYKDSVRAMDRVMACCVAPSDYHISWNHTVNGAYKHQSESQMAAFLTENDIAFTRDRENTINYAACPSIIPLPSEKTEKPRLVRPDFYLSDLSTELGINILIGNDEFQHRTYRCDFSRTLNISTYLALNYDDVCDDDIPLIYIRVNPHTYHVKDTLYDPKIEEVFKKLLNVIRKIESGGYGTKDQLKSLNLVYINYDVANPKAKGADKLKLFTSDTDDSNQNFAHALKDCVLDVLY